MPKDFFFGDGRIVGGQLRIPVNGKIDITNMDEFEVEVRKYLRPPAGLTLDFSCLTHIDNKGILKILKLKQDHQRSELNIVNVRCELREKFDTLMKCGISIQFLPDAA